MPTAPIVTRDGKQWYVWDFKAEFPYPFDPESPFFLLAAPPEGIGRVNYPVLVQGENGQPSLLDPKIDVTWIEWSDPTPEKIELIELRPGTTTQSQLSQFRIVMRRGKPGADGTANLRPTDFGTPVGKWLLALKSDVSGYEHVPQRVGGRYWPTTIAEAAAGSNATKVHATVPIPSHPYPIQVSVSGGTVVTGSGADIRVDLVARLNSEAGPVVGSCPGVGGLVDRLSLWDGPDAGATAATVTIPAGTATSVFLRTEKRSGADTYATTSTRFCVDVRPLAP